MLLRFGKWFLVLRAANNDAEFPEYEKGLETGYETGYRHGVVEGYFADPDRPDGTVPMAYVYDDMVSDFVPPRTPTAPPSTD